MVDLPIIYEPLPDQPGGLLFLCGLVVQGEVEAKLAAFSGMIRKPGSRA